MGDLEFVKWCLETFGPWVTLAIYGLFLHLKYFRNGNVVVVGNGKTNGKKNGNGKDRGYEIQALLCDKRFEGIESRLEKSPAPLVH